MLKTIFDILKEYHVAFFMGLKVTLTICAIVWGAGLFAGVILTYVAYKYPNPFYYLFTGITFLIIAIPFLVLLYLFHYPFQESIDQNIDPFITATTTLAAINSFLTYQLLIGSLKSIPAQMIRAGKVLGLPERNIALKIQIPLILRQFIPGFITLQVFMLQTSIFSSLISVPDIFRKAQQINASVQKPVEIYGAMALFFVLVCLPLYLLAYILNKKYSRDFSES